MFENVDMYLKYSQNLDLLVTCYNRIQLSSSPTLSALLRGEMEQIDSLLVRAETNLNWKSAGQVKSRWDGGSFCLHFIMPTPVSLFFQAVDNFATFNAAVYIIVTLLSSELVTGNCL